MPTQNPLKTFTLNSDNSINMMSLGIHQNEFLSIVTEFNNALSKSSASDRLGSNIHTVSQKTDNVLGLKTILMTQDIFVEE
jgi:hypothetical protein